MKSPSSPLVSIIIPCYKAEKELPEALASIHSQSYSHWEVIAVNDAWADSTQTIIENFSKAHPNHRVVFEKHFQNQGLGATRNTGMSLARGELIAFLDHDDIWEPDHLELSVLALKESQFSLSYSRVKAFDHSKRSPDWIWGPTEEELAHFPDSLFGRNYITPSSVVFKRVLLEELGPMDTDPKVHFCEDHEYWMRAVAKNSKLTLLDKITVRYRSNNPEAATSKKEMMLKHDLNVQKKHWHSLGFSRLAKKRSIARNYRALSELFWRKRHVLSLMYLLKSLFWEPFHFPTFRRLIKGFILAPMPKQKISLIYEGHSKPFSRN